MNGEKKVGSVYVASKCFLKLEIFRGKPRKVGWYFETGEKLELLEKMTSGKDSKHLVVK